MICRAHWEVRARASLCWCRGDRSLAWKRGRCAETNPAPWNLAPCITAMTARAS